MRREKRKGFTLIELLVTMTIVGTLVVLGASAGARLLDEAGKADSVARLRAIGQAVFSYAGDHDQTLPGPLWPGQVMLYDAEREGRLVRELASYLDIEPRVQPYLVERMIPRAYRRNRPSGKLEDARIYVVNSSILFHGQTHAPFGSLTGSPSTSPLRLTQLQNLPAEDRWMISEADQLHPDVVSAPWRANTPALPLHNGRRAVLDFDGGVTLESAAAP